MSVDIVMPPSITRYSRALTATTGTVGMFEDPWGEWVRYSDAMQLNRGQVFHWSREAFTKGWVGALEEALDAIRVELRGDMLKRTDVVRILNELIEGSKQI